VNVVQVVQTLKDEQRKLSFYMLNVRSAFFSNSVATTQKTLNIHCKYELVNIVQGNNHRLYCEDLQGVGKIQNSSLSKQMTHTVTTVLIGFTLVYITKKKIDIQQLRAHY
jgi:hypothetical protein